MLLIFIVLIFVATLITYHLARESGRSAKEAVLYASLTFVLGALVCGVSTFFAMQYIDQTFPVLEEPPQGDVSSPGKTVTDSDIGTVSPDNTGIDVPSTTGEFAIREVFRKYIEGGASCDIDGAYKLISATSKEIVRFTCQNYRAETECYENRDMVVQIKGDSAVIYRTPFSHVVENPVFFVREKGEWKIAFSKMAFGMVMAGSACDSGWNWKDPALAREFCSFFPQGECPDR